MIRFAENLNKMIAAGLGGAMEAPRTEVAVGHCIRYLEASGPVASFETNVVVPLKKLLVNMLPVQAGSGDPSPDNIRPISGRESVTVYRSGADMSDPQSVTVQLGQTVYGGTVDVVSGEMVVDRAIVDMGTLTWYYSNSVFKANMPENVLYSWTCFAICSNYVKSANRYESGLENFKFQFGEGSIASNRLALKIKDNNYDSAQTFASAMNGVQLVYELAQPITITLTPEQLTTLKGQNNVWSDAGDVTLEYPYYEETEGY